MPLKGFKSITIPEDLYILLRKYYNQHKKNLSTEHDVRSFTAFAAFCMRRYLDLLRYKQPIHVLLVDDEPSLLDVTKEFLEQQGESFQVDTAPSAEEALQRLSEEDYDVVVSDYKMHEMNGLEFLSHLRKKDRKTPFILLTGRGGEEIAAVALREGANDYIIRGKNLDSTLTELVHSIKRVFIQPHSFSTTSR